MEETRVLEKIKSNYVFSNIFEYLEEEIKLKLFIYSKLYQQKLKIDIKDYQSKYIQANIVPDDYMKFKNHDNNFDKEYLIKKFEKDLNKNRIDKDIFESVFIKNLENNLLNLKEVNWYKYFLYKIDIYSPFIPFLLKSKAFEYFFSINIKGHLIENHNLINDYISFFDKLNNSLIKYSSITFVYINIRQIKLLKKMNINLMILKN